MGEPPPRARTIREPADYEQDLSEAEAIFPDMPPEHRRHPTTTIGNSDG